MDYASRQLRNLANQDPTQQTTTIARALPYDLVFQTSDPSRKWVRYCLDTTARRPPARALARPAVGVRDGDGRRADAAMMGGCPGTRLGPSAGSSPTRHQPHRRPRPARVHLLVRAGAPASCPASSADHNRITNINAQLYVDTEPGHGARPSCAWSRASTCATRTSSPTADFTSTAPARAP